MRRHQNTTYQVSKLHTLCLLVRNYILRAPSLSPISARLLHSPNLVVIGLSVGYETWLPITLLWMVGLNIHWDYLVPHCITGSCDRCGFPPFYRPQWESFCTALNAVQWDCEIVYISANPLMNREMRTINRAGYQQIKAAHSSRIVNTFSWY